MLQRKLPIGLLNASILAHESPSRNRLASFTCVSCKRWKSSSQSQDHYKTLGLSRSASSKEIKSAYYDLSMKYHPDKNKDEGSVERFQEITQAYEVLGAADSKKAYDLTLRKAGQDSAMVHSHRPNTTADPPISPNRRSYTDLDIDFKDLEHFQRSTRRRRVYQKSESSMPEYMRIYDENEKRKRNKAAANGDSFTSYYPYMNPRAYEREREERRLAEELEERERRARHPIPTFEQLCREREANERKESRGNRTAFIAFFVLCLIAGFHRMTTSPRKRIS